MIFLPIFLNNPLFFNTYKKSIEKQCFYILPSKILYFKGSFVNLLPTGLAS